MGSIEVRQSGKKESTHNPVSTKPIQARLLLNDPVLGQCFFGQRQQCATAIAFPLFNTVLKTKETPHS